LDVKDFIKGMYKDEHLQASAKQVKFLQNKSVAMMGSPESTKDSEFSLALIKMREFLPPKPYCDRLIAIYCNYFERTFRVLHIPTFLLQYERLWTSAYPEASTSSVIPQLTSVMTMAYHMDDAKERSDDQTHKSYLKGAAIDLVQAWIDELTRKQRTELPTLQVEVLLLLSKSLRGLHPEKLWTSTGALVRSAMVMGLNLDPSAVTDFAPYQAEMRRRLWATILEIDLQASMTTGMPLVLPDPVCLVPSNLNDLDFDELSDSLPMSRSLDIYTDNIYQVILASSLPQRLKALSLVQRSAPDLQDAISLGRKVERCINSKPQVVCLRTNGVTPLDGGSLLHRVLLDLYLRRPALCLYKPLLLGPPQDTPVHLEIQRHCLDSSLAILSYQELYSLPALDAVTNNPIALQNFFYRCCKMDVLWGALTCCQHIKVLRQASSLNTNLDLGTGYSDLSLISTVEKTIDSLIDRIGQKGSDLKDIAFLTLVLQSVQLADASPGKPYALLQALNKTLAACREKLLQPMVSREQTLNALPTKRTSTSTNSILLATTNTVVSPIPNPRLTSVLIADVPFPMDLPENAQQWFGDLPGLANEFDNFQAGFFSTNDALNFGIAQDWDWEHMWQ
jgi:hypothetical protein